MKRRIVVFKAAVACLAAAAVMLAAAPGTAHAKRGLPDDIVETGCGEDNTDGTMVLVAVATNYGRTFKIGAVLAEVLCTAGMQVDVRFAKDITEADLAYYDAVILGSCIYIEHWHDDALAFLESYQSVLAVKSVAYYCVNALLGMKSIPNAAEMVQEYYIDPMYEEFPEIEPLDIKAFAGSIDYSILVARDWLMLRFLMPGGDWTDWQRVAEWGRELSGMIE